MRPAEIKEWLLDLVFPKFCADCGIEGSFLCRDCRQKLRFRAPSCPICSKRNLTGILCANCQEKSGLRRFLAPFSYRDPIARKLIRAYKYERVRELKIIFAEEITAFLNFYGIRPRPGSALVPIPLHRSRERERGFNQAALLAEELGARLNIPVVKTLARRRPTEHQTLMPSYEARRENVAGAFRIISPETIRAKTAILVDDVSTSGATMSEAARALREAGAHSVWAIVIAKG